jgi:membrane fusion protein (multidrug efflux system)
MAMPATFSRTLRSLETDRPRRRVVDLLIVAVVAAWGTWLVSARVALYEVSESARLEVEGAAHPIASPVAGRVVETRMAIGREVHAGEVLIVLDDQVQRDALRERRARSATLVERLEALRREIRAEREALAAYRQERITAVEASRAQVAEAEARATLAARQLARVQALRARGAASAEEHQHAQAEFEACRAALRALELTTARIEHEGQSRRAIAGPGWPGWSARPSGSRGMSRSRRPRSGPWSTRPSGAQSGPRSPGGSARWRPSSGSARW